VEDFVHRENLIIFKRRLADAKSDIQRQLLLKLLAEEEAKGGPLPADAAASRQVRYDLPPPR
jgi:polyhydroxyalkanoate synthesis regulator protein